MRDAKQNHKPLVYRTGGWAIAAGCLFMIVGTALVTGLVAMSLLVASEAPLIFHIALLVSTALPLGAAVLGFLLTLSGERVTLDPHTNEVRIEHGRWWTWKRETHAFSKYHAVLLQRNTSGRTGHDSTGGQLSHPVRLVADGDEVELASPSDYHTARRIAETVAATVNIPLHDATEAETVIRDPQRLDETLIARAQRLGECPTQPKPLSNHRISVKATLDATTIDLPRPNRAMIVEGIFSIGFLLFLYGGALGAAAYFLSGWLSELLGSESARFWPALIWSLLLLPVVYILLFGVILLTTHERIVVSHQSLLLRWQFPLGSWPRRISPAAIEEVICDKDAVLVRTDETTLRLGFALEKRERDWLRQMIHYALVARPKPSKRQ